MPSGESGANGRVSIELGKGISRRSLMKQMGAAGLATGLAGCQDLVSGGGGETATAANDGGAAATEGGDGLSPEDLVYSRHPMVEPPGWEASRTEQGAGDQDRRCVFVIQNVSNPFFVPLTCGFHDGLKNHGWTGELTGPTEQNVADQVSIINTVVDNLDAGDALITTVLDKSAYLEPIQKALDNDIAVINGHTTPDEREFSYEYQKQNFSYNGRDMVVPHVGILDEQGGTALAAEAYDRMKQKFPDQDEYTVLLSNSVPENPSVTRRIRHPEGGAKTFFEAVDDVSIHDIINPPMSISDARNEIVTIMQNNPEIDAHVDAVFWGPTGLGNAIGEGQIERDLVVCGFDLVKPLLNGIEAGNIDFTVGQDPYGQGYMSVPPLWMYLNRGIEMKDIEWGVSVVDSRNVEFALERRSWSALKEWQLNNYDALQ